MSKIIAHNIVAIRCDVRSCDNLVDGVRGVPDVHWLDLVHQLKTAVDAGWVFILDGRLGAYCQRHSNQLELLRGSGKTTWTSERTPLEARMMLTAQHAGGNLPPAPLPDVLPPGAKFLKNFAETNGYGPHAVAEVTEAAEAAGISRKSLRTGRFGLGIETSYVGGPLGAWCWTWPQPTNTN